MMTDGNHEVTQVDGSGMVQMTTKMTSGQIYCTEANKVWDECNDIIESLWWLLISRSVDREECATSCKLVKKVTVAATI